ncbi:MAG TPA: hypothetical protein VMT00_11145 [Thermoanaerobaculia bacterium]|nr:hypothetical protein [Thermoanaerobaculia bacterium]
MHDRAMMAARLRAALELHDAGVALMRQNLVRRHPEATPEEIERLLGQWLRTRPGAEHGDGEGIPRAIDEEDTTL